MTQRSADAQPASNAMTSGSDSDSDEALLIGRTMPSLVATQNERSPSAGLSREELSDSDRPLVPSCSVKQRRPASRASLSPSIVPSDHELSDSDLPLLPARSSKQRKLSSEAPPIPSTVQSLEALSDSDLPLTRTQTKRQPSVKIPPVAPIESHIRADDSYIPGQHESDHSTCGDKDYQYLLDDVDITDEEDCIHTPNSSKCNDKSKGKGKAKSDGPIDPDLADLDDAVEEDSQTSQYHIYINTPPTIRASSLVLLTDWTAIYPMTSKLKSSPSGAATQERMDQSSRTSMRH